MLNLFRYMCKLIPIPFLPTGCAPARSQEFIDSTLYSVLTYMSHMLTEQHMLVLTLLVVLDRLHTSRDINDEQIHVIIHGVQSEYICNNINHDNKPTWMSKQVCLVQRDFGFVPTA